jgi:NADPH-dependent curcumin reductase CurA
MDEISRRRRCFQLQDHGYQRSFAEGRSYQYVSSLLNITCPAVDLSYSSYWDHVGGATLDAALGNTAVGARFIECGMISHYNNNEGVTLKVRNFRESALTSSLIHNLLFPTFLLGQNLTAIMYKQTKIFGLLVSPFERKYGEQFYATVPKMVAEGKLKHMEDINKGLEKAGHLIVEQQTGKNFGKTVLIVAEE